MRIDNLGFVVANNHVVLTNLQFPVAIAKVHTVAQAIAPHLAVGALAGLHPLMVAVDLELVLPHVPETVLIDVALVIVAADAEAARDGSVGQHRGHVDTSAAREIVVAHLALILAEEAVAAIVGADPAFQPCLTDELHHHHKLIVAELEVGLVGGAAERKHREQSPTTDAQGDKEISELRQILDSALVDAGDNVPSEARMLFHGLNGTQHILVAVWIAAHPVVVFLEAIETHCQRLQPGIHKLVEFLGREQHAVAHHAPHEATFRNLLSAMGQVIAHGGFTTRSDDHQLARVLMFADLVQHLEEILKRHIVLLGEHTAIGTAVAAVEVATQRTFPKQLVKLVLVGALHQHRTVELEHDLFIKT